MKGQHAVTLYIQTTNLTRPVFLGRAGFHSVMVKRKSVPCPHCGSILRHVEEPAPTVKGQYYCPTCKILTGTTADSAQLAVRVAEVPFKDIMDEWTKYISWFKSARATVSAARKIAADVKAITESAEAITQKLDQLDPTEENENA